MRIKLLFDLEIKDIPGVGRLIAGQSVECEQHIGELLILGGLADKIEDEFETTEKKRFLETTELPRANRG